MKLEFPLMIQRQNYSHRNSIKRHQGQKISCVVRVEGHVDYVF